MRHLTALVFLSTLLISLWLVSSTPIDPNRWLINRPKVDSRGYLAEELERYRRFTNRNGVKIGTRSGVTGPRSELETNLRKGEYICGNKICKLKVGEPPKNCPEGLCQYPIL